MISEEIAITGITRTWKSLPDFFPQSVPLPAAGGAVSLFFVTGVVGGDGDTSGSLVRLVLDELQIKIRN